MDDLKTPQVQVSSRLVDSEAVMLSAIREELAKEACGRLAIMGGHFMLFEHESSGGLVPGVTEAQKSDVMRQRVAGRVGIFPGYSWDLSLDLLNEFGAEYADTRLVLLINDWQYVPAGAGTASEMRKRFFESFTELPERYATALERVGLGTDVVLSSRKHPLAFPETWLKYRFQKAAERFVKQGALEKRYLEDNTGNSEVSFLDREGNYRTLISCGVTGCAGEITELVNEVHGAGYHTLLLFAPGECLAPVRAGVEIALELYGLRGMKVVIADPGGSGEETVDEVFANMVNVITFTS